MEDPGGAEKISLLNLKAQYDSIKHEINEAVRQVLERQHFILGEAVTALEREIAAYCGASHAVGVASGSDALMLSLKAAGVGPRDEVIVPAFSFIASADSVSALGAVPVFADIHPDTFNLDTSSLERHLTPRTRAIIPVHLYGQPAAMQEAMEFAKQHHLTVIGDTAQALGARLSGKPVCSYGDFGCLSFFPSKNLGGYGDGGMITTDDPRHAALLRKLRSHGSSQKYKSEMQGWNSRLDELQAAVLLAKLPHLDKWNTLRAGRAELYNHVLEGIEEVVLPQVHPGRTHVFHQYTIRVPDRDRVAAELAQAGVQTAVYYPIPLHLQPMYAYLGYREGDLPAAEKASREVLSLPIYPELTDGEIERVGEALRAAVSTPEMQIQ